MFTSINGYLDIAILLTNKRANINLRNKKGLTAINLAEINRQYAFQNWLRYKNRKTKSGNPIKNKFYKPLQH